MDFSLKDYCTGIVSDTIKQIRLIMMCSLEQSIPLTVSNITRHIWELIIKRCQDSSICMSASPLFYDLSIQNMFSILLASIEYHTSVLPPLLSATLSPIEDASVTKQSSVFTLFSAPCPPIVNLLYFCVVSLLLPFFLFPVIVSCWAPDKSFSQTNDKHTEGGSFHFKQ